MRRGPCEMSGEFHASTTLWQVKAAGRGLCENEYPTFEGRTSIFQAGAVATAKNSPYFLHVSYEVECRTYVRVELEMMGAVQRNFSTTRCMIFFYIAGHTAVAGKTDSDQT